MISPHIAYACVMDDLIKLLTYKIKNNNTREADILELAHDGAKRIIDTLVDENQELRLRMISAHTKAKLLEIELKTIYNELYKRDSKFALDMITRSYIPTKRELNEEIIIKTTPQPEAQ